MHFAFDDGGVEKVTGRRDAGIDPLAAPWPDGGPAPASRSILPSHPFIDAKTRGRTGCSRDSGAREPGTPGQQLFGHKNNQRHPYQTETDQLVFGERFVKDPYAE